MRPALSAVVVAVAVVAAEAQGGGSPAIVPPAGAAIDATPFQYERRLPAGTSELVVLPLDAAVLAHSQGPRRRFGDVRLVDAQGLQVPYVLEARAGGLTLELQAERTTPKVGAFGSGSAMARSFYRIALPYAQLPEPVLVLETSAQVFLRWVEMGVQRPPDRRHREPWFESLTRRSWQHASARTPPPPLELPFRQVDLRELLLIVEDGDNQPLPVGAVRLRLPGWQLRFIRPAGPLRLLYGRSDLAEPRYDLALVADSAMSGTPREITAPPEISRETAAALVPARVFWIGLGAAVVVLLGLIVRLISRGTGPRPSRPGP